MDKYRIRGITSSSSGNYYATIDMKVTIPNDEEEGFLRQIIGGLCLVSGYVTYKGDPIIYVETGNIIFIDNRHDWEALKKEWKM